MLKQKLTKTLSLCAVAIMAIHQPVHAQINEFKITASDAAESDYFGLVSISGDYAIVGAFGNDDAGSESGSAYIFVWDGQSWTEQAKLTASDAAGGDGFGYSVSISGDYAIVGASGNDDAGSWSGSAYLFVRDGQSWTEQAKLTASDAAAGDRFGWSVSISGDYAVVGAYYDDDNGTNSGSAYVFKRSGTSWAQEAKLLASDGAAYDIFGYSVSISGDYAIVGAYEDDDNGNDSGSAYVFKRTGTSWVQEAKLLASDGAGDDYFGISVSISGDYAIVGAYSDQDNGWNSGSAYVFKRTGTSWAQEAKLLPSDGAAGDWFGYSVSISGDYAIVGAFGNGDAGSESGSAYLFVRDGQSWTEQAKLTASDAAEYDYFGSSVSISGAIAIVGAYYDDDGGVYSGSAYVYSGITVGIDDEISEVPTSFLLEQNYPNPFNPATTLCYDLPEQAYVTLVVYDLLGREVKRLVSGRVVSGYHAVVWDGTNNIGESVGAGVYLYRISTDKFTKTNKMILLR